jgi:hypothetical protein
MSTLFYISSEYCLPEQPHCQQPSFGCLKLPKPIINKINHLFCHHFASDNNLHLFLRIRAHFLV